MRFFGKILPCVALLFGHGAAGTARFGFAGRGRGASGTGGILRLIVCVVFVHIYKILLYAVSVNLPLLFIAQHHTVTHSGNILQRHSALDTFVVRKGRQRGDTFFSASLGGFFLCNSFLIQLSNVLGKRASFNSFLILV